MKSLPQKPLSTEDQIRNSVKTMKSLPQKPLNAEDLIRHNVNIFKPVTPQIEEQKPLSFEDQIRNSVKKMHDQHEMNDKLNKSKGHSKTFRQSEKKKLHEQDFFFEG